MRTARPVRSTRSARSTSTAKAAAARTAGRTAGRAATRAALATAAVGLGFAAAGCGSDSSSDAQTTVTVTEQVTTDAAAQSPSTGSSSPASAAASDVPQGASVDAVDATAAMDAALKHRPGTWVVDVDRDDDGDDLDDRDDRDDRDDGRSWEVTVVDADGRGTKIFVDRSSGEITSEREVRLDSLRQQAPSVTAADAAAAAVASRPGELESLELDSDDGRVAWEARIGEGPGEWELWIDPETGEILRTEHDD